MELRFWAATDTGRVREHNEDNFLVDERLQLFVVCDGMGGHAAGEVASAICVRTVREVIAAESELLSRLRDTPEDPQKKQVLTDLLGRAVLTACKRIFEMAQQDQSRRGMGTTCTAMVLAGPRGFVGHVGDSRMYRIRQGNLEQITTDHSLLNEMIRQGKIPADTREADFPHKNAVTRAVGVREFVEVDTFHFDVLPGDRLVMCSDGLSEYFGEGVDLMQLMGSQEPKETTTICIDHANRSGGKDNITVIVIDSVDLAQNAEEEQRVMELLQKTTYFHYLSPPELEQLRKMAQRMEFEAEEYVVSPEAANDKLFILLKGSVSLQLDGRQLSVLTTGENFGEMAVIDAQDEKDASLAARALEPTTVLAITRDQFLGLLRTAPGLAIKLLWNFVQVFADRLQSVPSEYRFTPDEWRREPDAAADLTPPSGSLVFEEDLKRIEERAQPRAEVDEEPRLMSSLNVEGGPESREPVVPAEPAKASPEPPPTPMVEESPPSDAQQEAERWETLDLGRVNPADLGVDPPRPGVTSRLAAQQGNPHEDDLGEDFDGESEEREGPWGLSSGTYDQRILAGGVTGTLQTDESSGMVTFKGQEADPDATLSPWQNGGGEEEVAEEEVDPESLVETVGLDADVDQLRGLRKQSARDLKEKLRERIKDRPAPSAEVLRKAGTPAEKAEAVTGGESMVSSKGDGQRGPESSEPKIMISPDLMAELDDDS